MDRPTIPIIVDTDIGGDIDDAWALALLLQSPEFDIKLITTSVGDTLSRAKITAKLLQAAGRCDIPIGIGLSDVKMNCYCDSWAKDYDLAKYPGKIYTRRQVASVIADTIMRSDREVTLLTLAPLTNIAAALDVDRRITSRSRIAGMLGSVYVGYNGTTMPAKECNVVNDIASAQKIFASDWDITITPLDTCGMVKLKGENYQRVYNCKLPLMRALMENYEVWIERPGYDVHPYAVISELPVISSTLFDTVAVYMALSTDFLEMQRTTLTVSDEGRTVVDEGGREVNCALKWKNLAAFENFITERLVNGVLSPNRHFEEAAASNRRAVKMARKV